MMSFEMLGAKPGVRNMCRGKRRKRRKKQSQLRMIGEARRVYSVFFPKASPMLGFSFSLLEGGWSEIGQDLGVDGI